jgi:pimeloyl-ACP methyl ester carboxylesterase
VTSGTPRIPVGSRIVATGLGPIECAVVGDGFPVLVLHGSPGGIDAAELMAGFLPRDQVRSVLVSRPGYLGTPLTDRRSIDDQADLLAALLDQLGIARAGVFSWSGGGPAGYRLAARHPDRVAALVAFAAISQRYQPRPMGASERFLMTTSAGQRVMRWLAASRPREYIAGVLSSEGSLTKDQIAQRVEEIVADDAKREFVLAFVPTASQGKRRRVGYRNDLMQFAAIDSLALETITAAALLVHGSADTDVPLVDSQKAATTIPGAQLQIMDAGTHLSLYTHPDATTTQRRVLDFLLAR